MTAQPDSARRPIVVGVDGSDESRAALAWALAEADLRGTGVVALHAWTLPLAWHGIPGPVLPASTMDELKDESVRLFEQAVAAVADDGRVERRVVEEVPAPALVRASEDAALLVVGSRGRGGFAGLLLGSVGYACAQRSACPVAIVRSPLRPASGRAVVVGVDGSGPAGRALAWGAEEALLRGSVVHALYALELPGWVALNNFARVAVMKGSALLDDAVERQLGSAAAVEREVVRTSAADALVRAAGAADVLVVGARGRGGFASLLLGSVSHQCIQHSSCPVVVVR